jgi:SAM-dependent methyltransferase
MSSTGPQHISAPNSAPPDLEWRPERYRDGFLSHGLTTEHERLRILESILDPHTTEKLADLGVGSGWRCLEVGAGAGSIARWMAHQGATVTATDLDTSFLDQLDEPGLTVLRHDMYLDDFPPGSFDLIHARYVVVHLPDQDTAISRLTSWLAPGGVLLLEEAAFFPIRDTPDSAYRSVLLALRDFLEDSVGTDTDWAKALPAPLRGKGLTDIGCQTRVQPLQGGGAEAQWWRLTLEQSRPHIVARGTVADSMFDRAFAELADPAFQSRSLAVFTAWGYRSG